MLTAEKILQDMIADYGSNDDRCTLANAEAGYRFAKGFDCLDSETWQEAHQRILASMDMISEEMDSTDDDEEARDIMRRRYAWIGEPIR